MAGLVAQRTRSALPHLLIQCPYCYYGVEYLDRGFSPGDKHKLECWSCERRILLRFDATVVHVQPLPVQLPFELLAIILAFASAGDTPDYSTLLAACLVSKSWNTCAMSVFYRHLHLGEWDARYQRTILRTLALRPSLYADVRSLTADFPRFEEWQKGYFETARKESFKYQVDDLVWDLEPDSEEARGILRARAYQEEFENESVEEAVVKTLREVRRRGAIDWMDVEDDQRRRGADELIRLAARCPGLEQLSLTNFDFDVSEEPPSTLNLPSVRSLTLNKPGSPDPTSALLSCMPNLETLDLSYSIPARNIDFPVDFSLVGLLPNLLHFRLLQNTIHSANRSFFLPFIQCSAATLRSLDVSHLGLRDEELNEFMGVLSTVSHLEKLSLELHGHHNGGEWDQPSVLAFFKSHTSLKHFSTMATLSLTFLESLPVSLVSLSIRAEKGFKARVEPEAPDRHGDAWDIHRRFQERKRATGLEGVQVIFEGKVARTPALEDVCIKFHHEGALSRGVNAVEHDAYLAGLNFELINSWEPIPGFDYY
ncbi:hypothetical protein RQP46_003886 [Phenoliferia psychrophenolica]